MDDLLIFGGLLLFIIGIVMLITSFLKKTKKKKALLCILIGFIAWVAGGAIYSERTPNEPIETEIQTEITEKIAPSEPVTDAIANEQDAIEAVKKYAKEQGYSETYDKFNATKEENSYFVMAGFSYLGDSWEGSADMYNVYANGEVILHEMEEMALDVLSYENSDFSKLSLENNTWYLEDLENAGSFMPVDFEITSEGILTKIELAYGVMKLNVLCTLDSKNLATGYDDGSGIGGLAKYTDEYKEGTGLYFKLLVKDSELYLAMYNENETPEYQKLITDKAMDVHNAAMDSIF